MCAIRNALSVGSLPTLRSAIAHSVVNLVNQDRVAAMLALAPLGPSGLLHPIFAVLQVLPDIPHAVALREMSGNDLWIDPADTSIQHSHCAHDAAHVRPRNEERARAHGPTICRLREFWTRVHMSLVS